MIEHSSKGIFVKSNIKRFIEFENCNLSRKLVEVVSTFSWSRLEGRVGELELSHHCIQAWDRFYAIIILVLWICKVWNEKKIGL